MVTIRRVVGPSMQPTYSPGTIVFGLRWLRPRAGRVVVAEHNGLEVIKRVIRVGEQGVFVMGDNVRRSTDSRTYGWLAPSSIKSVIIGSIKR